MPVFQVSLIFQDTSEMLCMPVCSFMSLFFACRISKICIGDIHSPSSPSCGERKSQWNNCSIGLICSNSRLFSFRTASSLSLNQYLRRCVSLAWLVHTTGGSLSSRSYQWEQSLPHIQNGGCRCCPSAGLCGCSSR